MSGTAPTRRQFIAAAGSLAGSAVLAACGAGIPSRPGEDGGSRARLAARPAASSTGAGAAAPTTPGTHALGSEPERDTLLHVPPGPPSGLVVSLHGAGGNAEGGLAPLRGPADERGLLLLAPASRGRTWDAIRGPYGSDVAVVDRALEAVFAAFPGVAGRLAVSGFSDGASYALGLGLANGDLFARVVAFSPGFVPDGGERGEPAVFISHGTADEVLPVDATGRKVVRDLRADGYDVTYREFDGAHVVPPEIARAAVDWLGWT